MINENLIISGIVRNNAHYLPNIFRNIKNISALFKNVKCIFVESDSTDNSLDLLNEFSKVEKNVEIISMGKLQNIMPYRTQRTSFCRNVYLEKIKQLKEEYSLCLMMDMDDVNSYPIDKKSILSNFNYSEWDMITANNPDGYYDIWALRHTQWMPYDCWKAVGTRPSFMSNEEAINIHVRSRIIKIDVNHPLIEVQSAFSGMAFVKTNSIKNAKFIGLENDNGNIREVVEWINFCETLNEGNAKIFINPRFVTNTQRTFE
jgi:hypothetical protein